MQKNATNKPQKSDTSALLISALMERLHLTIEERIESHENARKLLLDLANAGKELRARSQKTS